jgi:hypothetical protein
MYGYWYLGDDYMFFGKYGNFSATISPDLVKLNNYDFTTLSPIPSFTGKYAAKFLGTMDSSITVSIYILEAFYC